MRWKQMENQPKVFAVIFETGDEIARVLQQFSKEQGLGGCSFKAIGALSYAKLGWFNWDTKKYEPASVLDEQVELLSLIGDIDRESDPPSEETRFRIRNSVDPNLKTGLLRREVLRSMESLVPHIRRLRSAKNPCHGTPCRWRPS